MAEVELESPELVRLRSELALRDVRIRELEEDRRRLTRCLEEFREVVAAEDFVTRHPFRTWLRCRFRRA
jgi:hypothetical protein